MKYAHVVAAWLLLVLCVIHIGMAPVFFDDFGMRVMWYVAQGLMGVFVAFLNLAARHAAWREPLLKHLTHAANILGLAFAVLYLSVDTSPPSMVAVAVFALLAASALVISRARAAR